jgi:hypothetical protein
MTTATATAASLSAVQADVLLDLLDTCRDTARAAHTAALDDPRRNELLRADTDAYMALVQAVQSLTG